MAKQFNKSAILRIVDEWNEKKYFNYALGAIIVLIAIVIVIIIIIIFASIVHIIVSLKVPISANITTSSLNITGNIT